MPSANRFSRRSGTRQTKDLVVIFSEGQCTEKEYIAIIKENFPIKDSVCIVVKPSNGKGSPEKLLKAAKKYVKDEKPRQKDSLWIMIDRDEWPHESIEGLHAWCSSRQNTKMLLSNPCFEIWLLMHFLDGSYPHTKNSVCEKISNFTDQNYKHPKGSHYPQNAIEKAIRNAKRQYPQETDWPRHPGASSVYWLLEALCS